MEETLKALIKKKHPEIAEDWDRWSYRIWIESPRSLDDRPVVVVHMQTKAGAHLLTELLLN